MAQMPNTWRRGEPRLGPLTPYAAFVSCIKLMDENGIFKFTD